MRVLGSNLQALTSGSETERTDGNELARQFSICFEIYLVNLKIVELLKMNKPELAFEAADASAIEEVNLAYENVREVDGLDITKEGNEAWEAAMKRYEERIDRVETRITARLRDQVSQHCISYRTN